MSNIAVRVPPSLASMRGTLREFFEGMIYKLDRNSHKNTPTQNDILTMVDLLRGELDELVEQLHENPTDPNILRESQDAANYAFLVFHALRSAGVNTELELFIRKYYRVDTGTGRVYVAKTRAGSQYKVGDEVRGSTNDRGQVFIKVQGRGSRYAMPRSHLVWFAEHGVFPTGILDHDDRNPGNDAIGNLKDCSFSDNNFNTDRSDARQLPRYVTQYMPSGRDHLAHYGKFVYQRHHNGVNIRVGYFDTPEQASSDGEAQWTAKIGKL